MVSQRHKDAQGTHGVGGSYYTQAQYDRVVAAFLALRVPVTVAELSSITGVAGTPVRAIMAAADGKSFVLGGSERAGYSLASSRAEMALKSRRLASQVGKMSERLARRDALAEKLWGGV